MRLDLVFPRAEIHLLLTTHLEQEDQVLQMRHQAQGQQMQIKLNRKLHLIQATYHLLRMQGVLCNPSDVLAECSMRRMPGDFLRNLLLQRPRSPREEKVHVQKLR